jgi:hypothetical protein
VVAEESWVGDHHLMTTHFVTQLFSCQMKTLLKLHGISVPCNRMPSNLCDIEECALYHNEDRLLYVLHV